MRKFTAATNFFIGLGKAVGTWILAIRGPLSHVGAWSHWLGSGYFEESVLSSTLGGNLQIRSGWCNVVSHFSWVLFWRRVCNFPPTCVCYFGYHSVFRYFSRFQCSIGAAVYPNNYSLTIFSPSKLARNLHKQCENGSSWVASSISWLGFTCLIADNGRVIAPVRSS